MYIYIYVFLSFFKPQHSHPGIYDQPRPSYMNGHTIPNNGLSPSSSSPNQSQQHLSDTNLYIKNLPPDYSDQDLAKLVEGYRKNNLPIQ
jgi:RNA recognition motif-containing protein